MKNRSEVIGAVSNQNSACIIAWNVFYKMKEK